MQLEDARMIQNKCLHSYSIVASSATADHTSEMFHDLFYGMLSLFHVLSLTLPLVSVLFFYTESDNKVKLLASHECIDISPCMLTTTLNPSIQNSAEERQSAAPDWMRQDRAMFLSRCCRPREELDQPVAFTEVEPLILRGLLLSSECC